MGSEMCIRDSNTAACIGYAAMEILHKYGDGVMCIFAADAYIRDEAEYTRVMKEAAEYLDMLDTIDTAKIAVVYKKAVGLGYSLFAAKSVGFDYTCAFANAKIALFDSVQGALVELGDEKADKAALSAKYADENSDPVNAAKNGYIDAIIEPQFVKQYLIASLQMLAK